MMSFFFMQPKQSECKEQEVLSDIKRYERLGKIGEGSYGKVYKARNCITNETVALEMISMDIEKVGVPSTTIREISVLKEMQHPNIVSLRDVQYTEKDMCLVFEYPGHGSQETFLRQILCGVAYCHSHRVLHRDLKPQNLLIDCLTSTIKLADFGLARACSVPIRTYSHEDLATFVPNLDPVGVDLLSGENCLKGVKGISVGQEPNYLEVAKAFFNKVQLGPIVKGLGGIKEARLGCRNEEGPPIRCFMKKLGLQPKSLDVGGLTSTESGPGCKEKYSGPVCKEKYNVGKKKKHLVSNSTTTPEIWAFNKKVINESLAVKDHDAASVIQLLSDQTVPRTELGAIIHTSLALGASVNLLSYVAVRREANSVAHGIAQHALSLDSPVVWIEEMPPDIARLVRGDSPNSVCSF
ncbi:hypothetical protein Q3G72_004230 [Acer saccharum]|nr:hypothetical protein Q3G72_004230 [Acer saccharum]